MSSARAKKPSPFGGWRNVGGYGPGGLYVATPTGGGVECIVHPAYGPHEMHFVYVIRGPGGAYVGCSRNVTARWRRHRASAGRARGLLYEAMRRDGSAKYSCEIVACADSCRSGESAEDDVVRQLRADGECVFNVLPRDGFYPGKVRTASVVQDVARARQIVATHLRYKRDAVASARKASTPPAAQQSEAR